LYRAKTLEDSPILARKSKLSHSLILHKDERDAIYNLVKGIKKRMIVDISNNPMVHHYSWVRTKKEMLKKVNSWGHKNDRDWNSLVEEEFSKEFQGKDFIHGYSFEKVKPFVSIDMAESQHLGLIEKEYPDNLTIMSKNKLENLVDNKFFYRFLKIIWRKIHRKE
jgi:hypothetical protein